MGRKQCCFSYSYRVQVLPVCARERVSIGGPLLIFTIASTSVKTKLPEVFHKDSFRILSLDGLVSCVTSIVWKKDSLQATTEIFLRMLLFSFLLLSPMSSRSGFLMLLTSFLYHDFLSSLQLIGTLVGMYSTVLSNNKSWWPFICFRNNRLLFHQ